MFDRARAEEQPGLEEAVREEQRDRERVPGGPEPGLFTVAGTVALVLAVAGAGLAWAMYGRRPVAARKELYGNTVNEALLMRPGQWLTRLSVYFDNRGVDGLVNTVAATVGGTSGRVRRVQTGFVRSYALSMLIGAVLLVGALLLVRI